MKTVSADFRETMQTGPAFDKTQPMHVMSGTDRHRQHGEGTIPPQGMHKLAQTPSEDKSMWIIVGIAAFVVLVYNLPKFQFFQNATAINAWIPFFKNVLGLI
jgi:hypothetical protein